MELLDLRMNDGSRHFAAIPEKTSWSVMRRHIASLAGATVTDYSSDGVTEVWIEFTYHDFTFSVNNQWGEFWFFVDDPTCPDGVLTDIVAYCESV